VQTPSNQQVRVYITLKKRYEQEGEYKKMLLMATGASRVFELKRRLEREFSELFPNEPPFVVAKLEDSNGFALSNSSLVKDVVAEGDMLIA
jgi:hypothetical protein